jgi:ABC-type sugar transport system ATPase subunit
VTVLSKGRLQQVDSPQYLFESSVNLFVAGFISSPAMISSPLHWSGTIDTRYLQFSERAAASPSGPKDPSPG